MSIAQTSRRLAASLVLGARQRLALAALDVEEEVLRAGCAVATMLGVAALATLALAAIAAAVAVLLWDRSPVAALLGMGATFAVLAALLAWRLAAALRAKPPFMAATLEEMRMDAQRLEERGA